MTASYGDVLNWEALAKEQGATHIISVCDTFDWDDYPVYVMPGQDVDEVVARYLEKDMQIVNEVIEVV